MAYYKDLREYVSALEDQGKLIRVKREINKDTEAMPLVRCQFRGLPEVERKAFLFENVADVKGKKYSIPLLVASHAASRHVYAIGMMCKPEEIMDKWTQARLNPIEPKVISSGPVQDEVHLGENLLQHGGLGEFPVPISTPGFDNAPYLSAAHWVSRDPDTGTYNIGTYRAMLKSGNRLGMALLPNQHMRLHWEKCKAKGIPLQAAIVIGSTPNIGFVSSVKVPYGTSEYAVAGGIAGEPVQLVKCQTVDIEVPATAGMIFEGEIPTDYMEREAPFGEYTGYMGLEALNPYFDITCITHRKDAIFNAFLSQFPPSESSMIRRIGFEANMYKFLKQDCNLPVVLDVAFHEESGSSGICVIKMKKTHSTQSWQALKAAEAYADFIAKFVIVVDEDIDARDIDSVMWALCYRVQPHRDTQIVKGGKLGLDISVADTSLSPAEADKAFGSALLIDATIKWDYPPVSLPKREFMEKALKIWEELGLPELKLKAPWYGYQLGLWTEENEKEAELALKGEYHQTGEKLAKQRTKV
ncbi:UbiD family decarboxylase [Chloroflexota bacterium]